MTIDVSQDKDSLLKLRIRKILWSQGYYCPLEVDISHHEYEYSRQNLKRTPITDIDVLGIRFESDLRCTTIIADCKSGKESEANRIFWLRGVMDFFGAQEGLFIKTIIHSQARDMAPKLNIRTLDQRELEVLEKSLALDKIRIGIADLQTYSKMNSLWGIDVKSGTQPTEKQLLVKNVYSYLKYQYWMIDDYRNIQTNIENFSKVSDILVAKDVKSKYLAYIGLQRLSLSILRMANYIATHGLSDIKNQSRTYLFGGAFLVSERTRIISLLNVLSKQMEIEDQWRLEPPYFDELVEIVNRIILNSRHGAKILQHLDTVIVEAVLGSNQKIEQVMGNTYSTDALVLTKRIANLLQRYANLEDGMFSELYSL